MSPRWDLEHYIGLAAADGAPAKPADGGAPAAAWCWLRAAAWMLCGACAAVGANIAGAPWRRAAQLWDPHFRPEYAHEPLGKKTVRYFDQYLMARAGVDDQASFQANVDRGLAPDVVFESAGWGPGGGALVTRGRDKWTGSGEERRFRAAFGSTELFTQMLLLGGSAAATTTSYGTLFWSGELFGMPAPNRWVELRVCDFYRIRRDARGFSGGLITYNFMMIDWPDVVHRAGLPVLPPARLQDGVVLPPAANDGVPAPFSILAQSQDEGAARAAMEGILRSDWSEGDGAEDGRWWHPDLTFYGPRGVGLARGLRSYEEQVLRPFRAAFANRTVEAEVTTCEGNYCAAMGNIRGRHVSPWLGLSASGRHVEIRFGMHWRIADGRAVEGWAIFDVPGLFKQLGLDFFASAVHGSPRALATA